MPLSEVVFKVMHDCPFGNLSRRFPTVKMFAWCNREHDIIELIIKEPEEYPAVMEAVSKMQGVIDRLSDRGKVHVITKDCYCNLENSVTKNIEDSNLLNVLPVIYEDGWEYYRTIAFRHEDLEALLHRLDQKGFEFEILRKVPFDGFLASSLTLTADALFSNLTAKQIDALITAYRNGYYRLPRKADVKTIAFKKRVPRTTFQEHLKKAENKLVAALVPYIQLFSHASLEKRQSLKIR